MSSSKFSLQSCSLESVGNYLNSVLKPWVDRAKNNEMTTIYTATAVGALLLLMIIKPSKRGNSKKTKSSKRSGSKRTPSVKSKPVSLENQIENVYRKYVDDYKEGLDKLTGTYDANSEKDQYQLNYYNEMLLKLVIELDGVDLVDIEPERKTELKNRRKQVIREIQSSLKQLDTLKHS